METFRNWLWRVGVRFRNFAKRVGVLGSLERPILRLAPLLIPASSTEVFVTLPRGSTLIIPPGFPSGRSYVASVYEPAATRVFEDLARGATNVVDVGANIGYYSLLASTLVDASGHVYAFEPDKSVFEHLSRNISVNRLMNVSAESKAVSDSTGHCAFVRDKFGAQGHLSKSAVGSSGSIVSTTTLDAYFAHIGWPVVQLLKMDIEGGETAALHGMEELLRRSPGIHLLMEYDEGHLRRSGSSREELVAVLTNLGFSRGYLVEKNMMAFSVSSSFPRSAATHNVLLSKC